jgi:hypothetical protein
LAGGASLSSLGIVDANAVSVLLWDSSSTLYRAPLSGYGANPPAILLLTDSRDATEDASGVYWFDSTGTLRRCAAGNCDNARVTLATSQGTVAGLYQDDTALYWGSSSSDRIVRLAK